MLSLANFSGQRFFDISVKRSGVMRGSSDTFGVFLVCDSSVGTQMTDTKSGSKVPRRVFAGSIRALDR